MNSSESRAIVARPAVLSDWANVWPLLESMGKTDGHEQVRARFRELIASDDHLIVIAFIDNAAVGYAWAQDRGEHLRSGWRTARLHDLFVLPSQRRAGVGRHLFSRAKEWSKHRRVRWLEWQASTDAVGFYKRLGMKAQADPDPAHPYFEIDLSAAPQDADTT